MNDKELEERKEEIKNSNSNIPICVVRDVKITDDSYLLKVVFNKKRKGNNEERTIKLKKSYFSKGTTLNGKTLTGKLYLLFKIDKYSDNENERNIKLFSVLKKIGVVTKDNKIDVNKFKGIVFQAGKNNSIRKIKKNPSYVLRYDYLFNGESPSVVNYHTKKMFNEKGYEKDYREFKKADRKNVKMLKDDATELQEQKVNKVTNGLDRVIKDGYKGENTKTDCDALIEDFLTVASQSKFSVKQISITNLSKLFCNLIKQVDEQNRRIDNQDRIIDELGNKVSHLESCIEDRDVTIREYKERFDEQDRIIRKQDRKIEKLKSINRRFSRRIKQLEININMEY